ncbi:hypothetical protein BDV93DRAFT_604964 [Ceratobasidium sp. AG-I]|nr:hypothetical protein BDV93DRAFT_604964 [Ceratobasidium sp. AG-I]
MSSFTLNGLDDLERDWLEGSLKPDTIDVPTHQIPPDPNDSDTLPSQVHPSYPYGNPTKPSHPVAVEPLGRGSSRTYYDDMRFEKLRRLDRLRWTNLALDLLLPVDHEKEEAMKAAAARRAASGATANNQSGNGGGEAEPEAAEEEGEDGEEEGEEEDEEVEGSGEDEEFVNE